MLNQGIPTGGKHCIPLANILLSFLLMELMEQDTVFKNDFTCLLKIWKRFIDDCFVGMFLGNERNFEKFFKKITEQFKKYDLEITCEKSREKITILDIEVFKEGNKLHTKESRKETASNSYLRFGSAHPNYTYKGIIKSQMYRLRKLCSRDEDFTLAISNLQKRCLNSGYDPKLVNDILKCAKDLKREIKPSCTIIQSDIHKIRWITLSQSFFGNDIKNFAKMMNEVLKPEKIQFELVKTTAPNIGKLLFNNRDVSTHSCVSV